MGFFDDIFGNAFDFNGDGHTDATEEFLAFQIFEDMENGDSDNNDLFNDNDLFDDTDMFDDKF